MQWQNRIDKRAIQLIKLLQSTIKGFRLQFMGRYVPQEEQLLNKTTRIPCAQRDASQSYECMQQMCTLVPYGTDDSHTGPAGSRVDDHYLVLTSARLDYAASQSRDGPDNSGTDFC